MKLENQPLISTEYSHKLITVDNNAANFLYLMSTQYNPQIRLHLKVLAKKEWVMKVVDVSLEQVGGWLFSLQYYI